MSLDVRYMSRQELQFLKLYAVTLKRHFSVFVSALNMMRATELDLKCPVEAARVANGINALHAEFDQTLVEITRGNRFRVKPNSVEHPTPEEVTRIIQISFFKLVDPKSTQNLAANLGWFSGHPLDWEGAWKQLTSLESSTKSTIASALINALANLFNMGYSAKLKKPPEAYEEPDEDDEWYDQDDYEHP